MNMTTKTPTKPVRVTVSALDTVRRLAERTGMTQQQVIDKAVETLRRQIFLDSANAAYASLRQDQSAWEEEQTERTAWDETLADGEAS